MKLTHALLEGRFRMTIQARHGRTASIKRCVTTDPETVDVIYRRWKGIHDRKTLTRSLRDERRWVASILQALAEGGQIERRVYNEDDEAQATWVGFRKVSP